jgi:hypothetical protein
VDSVARRTQMILEREYGVVSALAHTHLPVRCGRVSVPFTLSSCNALCENVRDKNTPPMGRQSPTHSARVVSVSARLDRQLQPCIASCGLSLRGRLHLSTRASDVLRQHANCHSSLTRRFFSHSCRLPHQCHHAHALTTLAVGRRCARTPAVATGRDTGSRCARRNRPSSIRAHGHRGSSGREHTREVRANFDLALRLLCSARERQTLTLTLTATETETERD